MTACNLRVLLGEPHPLHQCLVSRMWAQLVEKRVDSQQRDEPASVVVGALERRSDRPRVRTTAGFRVRVPEQSARVAVVRRIAAGALKGRSRLRVRLPGGEENRATSLPWGGLKVRKNRAFSTVRS